MAKRSTRKATTGRSFFRLIPRHGAFPIALVAGLLTLAATYAFVPGLSVVIGADAMFVVYLAIVGFEVPGLTPDYLKKHANESDVPVWAILIITLAIVGICAFSLFTTLNGGESGRQAMIVPGLASVLLGWFVVHTMAALHYAYEYYESPSASPNGEPAIEGGLGWPEGEKPNGVAFLYIAYQIGAAMQMADVCATSNKMRALIASHIVFAFFYNTLLVAAAVNVVIAIGSG